MDTLRDWLREHSTWFEYSALALAIMLPLLLPGFILTLDLVFTPHVAIPDEITNTYPVQLVLWLLDLILPAEIVEKLILFTILLCSGVGAHKLVRTIPIGTYIDQEYARWGAYFAGIFYMINPFSYARFMAGQWMVLLGYALLPFFVLALVKLIAKPGLKTAAFAALWAAVISAISIHHIGILLLLGVVATGVALWRYKDSKRVTKLLAWSAASLGLMLIMSSYWLVPTLTGKSSIAQAVSGFDSSQFQAFETNNMGGLGAVGNVIRLQGFWAEAQGLFVLPQDRIPAWGLIGLLVWIVVGIGAAAGWRSQKFMTLWLGISTLLAGLLATAPLVPWASEHLPFIGGYREPHKFVNLIVLAYAYFGALGASRLLQISHEKWGETGFSGTLCFVLILPIIFTPTMLWGFGKQLSPSHYPDDWYTMNEQLHNGEDKVLFLPWHQYMQFSFTNRIIANPADKFFDANMLVGDNPEFKGIKPTTPSAEKQKITQALRDRSALSATLTELEIHYVLLAKEGDYKEYAYLNKLQNLRLLSETGTLLLYENTEVRGGTSE